MNATSIYDDKQKQREIRHILDDMGLCGCASGEVYELVHALLERAEKKGSFYEPLGSTLSGPGVEFVDLIMGSSNWGLLEHGTSIRYAWLTPKGQLLLQFLRDFGIDTESWPNWWFSAPAGEDW